MAKNDTKAFSAELLDQLLAGRDPKTVLDSGGLIGDLKKALAGILSWFYVIYFAVTRKPEERK